MTDAPERIWAELDGNSILVHNGAPDLEVLIATGYLHEYIRKDLAAPTVKPLTDVDTLSNIIRAVDGNHTLGAGELAERILSALK